VSSTRSLTVDRRSVVKHETLVELAPNESRKDRRKPLDAQRSSPNIDFDLLQVVARKRSIEEAAEYLAVTTTAATTDMKAVSTRRPR
jgi:hypothetical protein